MDFKNRETLAPGYVDAIMILSYRMEPEGAAEDPAEHAMMAAGDKVTINYRYCCNTLDLTKDTFAEAIRHERYVTNECWINALYDFYGDKLLDPNRSQRYRITRQDILDILGKTEENIKQGLTINEVVPFFEKFKLKLRVYDIFKNLVFRYDPPIDHRHNPAMYCMFHESHVYTLNDRLDSLAQTGEKDGNDDDEVVLRVGSDYRVKECKGRKHRMIEHVDDILQLLKETAADGNKKAKTEEDEAIYMIHKQDDLEQLLMQMREKGHSPQVKLERTGKVSMIIDEWNKQKYIIRAQQLTPTQIDGMVYTSKPEIYDKIDEVFADMKNKTLKMEHKSYYTEQDMVILDNCRTIANVGWLKLPGSSAKEQQLIEIDMTRAYTWAFCEIKHIPVFNEFDIWKPFKRDEAIKPLNLYIIKQF